MLSEIRLSPIGGVLEIKLVGELAGLLVSVASSPLIAPKPIGIANGIQATSN